MDRNLKIGFIGFGKHAQKLLNMIVLSYPLSSFKLFNHRENYDKTIENLENVYNLEDLNDCDAVFIVSPNSTHFNYIKFLVNNYNGYVFCEKPPVTQDEEIRYLETIPKGVKKRFYFNFNYRFSPYVESLKYDPEKYALGRLVTASIIQGHGYAFKDCYKSNWRSSCKTHKSGVFETFAIHFADMFVYCFGFPEKFSNYTASFSLCSDSIDNASFMCQFTNKATLTLSVSYTTPKINSVVFVYENGYIEFSDTKKIYGPRDFFDENGLFIEPPLIAQETIDSDIHFESLKSSVEYFMEKVEKEECFDIKEFDCSIETNKLLLVSKNL